MGNKIFVSYKYADSNVAPLPGCTHTQVRDYVDYMAEHVLRENIYKGERQNEDLSMCSEEYIREHLKNKIYDSSLTIVVISPNMKEPNMWQKSQWIPWEVSYSLRLTTRDDRTSQRNALLGVILPDSHGSYDYYDVNALFPILRDNIRNGYMPVVRWDYFRAHTEEAKMNAYFQKGFTPDYRLTINL